MSEEESITCCWGLSSHCWSVNHVLFNRAPQTLYNIYAIFTEGTSFQMLAPSPLVYIHSPAFTSVDQAARARLLDILILVAVGNSVFCISV